MREIFRPAACALSAACLALAMSATLLLVIDVVYDRTWAAAIAAIAAGFFAWLWYGMPLMRRRERD